MSLGREGPACVEHVVPALIRHVGRLETDLHGSGRDLPQATTAFTARHQSL